LLRGKVCYANILVRNRSASQTKLRPRIAQQCERSCCVNAVPSVFRPDIDPAWVSEPYGGLATEVSPGAGGLLASAPAVVGTIAHQAVWGFGPRSPGLSRIGDMPGTFTCASSRGNGFDWAVLSNGNDGLTDATRGKLLNDLNAAIDALS
jgi:hypothetical protein